MTRQGSVLVTGSNGLLGRAVCRALARQRRVFGLDLHAPDQPQPDVEFVQADLTDDDSVRTALDTLAAQDADPWLAVVHLAAHYDFSGAHSPLYQELTVQGTRRLLRATRDLGVRQFVFASSVLAMRPAEEGQLLHEGSPELAEWAYPASKLEAEGVLRREQGDEQIVVLRIAGCYDEDGHSIPIAQQIRRIHERQFKSLFFPGDAGHGQSFVHVEDVAACMQRVVARAETLRHHDVLLVAEPAWLSYRDLQDRVGLLLHGREWHTLRVPGPLAKAGAWLENKVGGDDSEFIKPWMIDLADAHYPVDIRKARAALDWEPRHRLSETLPLMIERLRADPAAWYRENGLEPEDAPQVDAHAGEERFATSRS